MTPYERCEHKIKMWINWSEKNGRTPKRHSEDIEEARFAARISACVCQMRKDPETYSSLLTLYSKVYKSYDNWDVEKYTCNEVLLMWCEWFEKYDIVPRSKSKQRKERALARRFKEVLAVFQGEPQKYAEELKLVEELRLKSSINRKRKTLLKIFSEWKEWVMANGKLPYQLGKGDGERHVATAMSEAIKRSQKEGKNEDIIVEYYTIVNKYKK